MFGGIPALNFQLRLIPEAFQPRKGPCVPNLPKDVIWCMGFSIPKKGWLALLKKCVVDKRPFRFFHRFIRGPDLGTYPPWPLPRVSPLQDARPEPDREGEEVCGCNCPVPWKAAACFLERLLEPRLALVQHLGDFCWHHFFFEKKRKSFLQFWVLVFFFQYGRPPECSFQS